MTTDVRDRLRTVDERGRRLWVYADLFNGPWRARRRIVSWVLILFYLVLPWISWHGLPVFQIDILGQRLVILGQILAFNETSLILPLIFSFAFMIFALTAVGGRVWCGWACPQTVFLDFLFRPIENWVEGRPLERKKLDQSRLTLSKFNKKVIKWSYYIAMSFIIANTFIAYFAGSDGLLTMMGHSPIENPIFFGVMFLVFAGFLFNFGWFREQMCTIACPYGRLQSVLLDKNSLIVAYDKTRGEPRGKGQTGACVDCNRCVQVCPTGIDIRDGLQLECINCAACIDACNYVMSKVNRAPNLIGFTTEVKLQKKTSSSAEKNWRPILYGSISVVCLSLSVYGVFSRANLEVLQLRKLASNIVTTDSTVQNQVGFLLTNKSLKSIEVLIQSPTDSTHVVTAQNPIRLAPREKVEVQVFVTFPKTELISGVGHKSLQFTGKDISQNVEFSVFGPEETK